VREDFAERLESLRPDAVHFHSLQGLHYGLPALARESGARVLWTLHDFFALCQRVHLVDASGRQCSGPRGGLACSRCLGGLAALAGKVALPLRTAALRSALRSCDVLVAPSRFVAETFESTGVQREAVHVVPTAVPRPPRSADAAPSPGRPRLVFAGDLRAAKGADLAIEAVRELRGAVELHVHGGPPRPGGTQESEFSEGLSLAAEAGDAAVVMHGRYEPEHLLGFLDGATALLVPSRVRESFGRTANLALQAGVPVIAANHGALPEQVAEGLNGALFRPGDASDLALAIERTVARARELRAGRAGWPSAPSLDDHIDALLPLYGRAA